MPPYFEYPTYSMFGFEDYIYRMDEELLLPLVDGETYFSDYVHRQTRNRRFSVLAASKVVLM